jgi:putative DNA primase/helicase
MIGVQQERLEAVRAGLPDIAVALMGNPSFRGSRELRWGRQGSFCINLEKNVYFDHEAGEGGDAIRLIRREMALDFRSALAAGEELLGLAGEATESKNYTVRHTYNYAKVAKSKQQPKSNQTEYNKNRRSSREANELWYSALPLEGSLASVYLDSVRRCGLPGYHCCRFVPALKHSLSGLVFPCILSLVTDPVTGAKLTLHMTYLAEDGRAKAPVARPRLFWPGLAVGTGVVRLSSDDEVEGGLFISEGLEDGQSLLDYGMRPLWACLSAGSMGNFPVLAGIGALTLCPDADTPGRKSAIKCRERWTSAGREVTVTFPRGSAKDFNEVAMSRAVA